MSNSRFIFSIVHRCCNNDMGTINIHLQTKFSRQSLKYCANHEFMQKNVWKKASEVIQLFDLFDLINSRTKIVQNYPGRKFQNGFGVGT